MNILWIFYINVKFEELYWVCWWWANTAILQLHSAATAALCSAASLNPPRPINKMFYLIVWISSAPPPVDTHSGFMETITLFIISFPWLLTSERTLHCVLESPSYFKPPSSPCLRAVIVLILRAPADKREADWAVHLAGVSEHLDLWANKFSILCLLTITNNRGDPLHLHLTINSGV